MITSKRLREIANAVNRLRFELLEADVPRGCESRIVHACDGLYAAEGYLATIRDDVRVAEDPEAFE